MLNFTVYGDPRPQARPRMTKTGHVYTPADSANYRECVRHAAAAAMHGRELITTPCELFLQIVRQSKTTGFRKGEREWLDVGGLMLHDKKPDIDNLIKQVADACNGVVWRDDSQVVIASAIKLHGREPLINVWVSPVAKMFYTNETVSTLHNKIKEYL